MALDLKWMDNRGRLDSPEQLIGIMRSMPAGEYGLVLGDRDEGRYCQAWSEPMGGRWLVTLRREDKDVAFFLRRRAGDRKVTVVRPRMFLKNDAPVELDRDSWLDVDLAAVAIWRHLEEGRSVEDLGLEAYVARAASPELGAPMIAIPDSAPQEWVDDLDERDEWRDGDEVEEVDFDPESIELVETLPDRYPPGLGPQDVLPMGDWGGEVVDARREDVLPLLEGVVPWSDPVHATTRLLLWREPTQGLFVMTRKESEDAEWRLQTRGPGRSSKKAVLPPNMTEGRRVLDIPDTAWMTAEEAAEMAWSAAWEWV